MGKRRSAGRSSQCSCLCGTELPLSSKCASARVQFTPGEAQLTSSPPKTEEPAVGLPASVFVVSAAAILSQPLSSAAQNEVLGIRVMVRNSVNLDSSPLHTAESAAS